MLVDEYQDIGLEQYEPTAAIAGRSLGRWRREALLSFAVGDDDQNIYAFSGTSVRFIRRFERDYTAGIAFLADNERSPAHIVAAANTVMDDLRAKVARASRMAKP